MGVHGLWQLLSSTGKPVPLESLEGKVLAVDVSVWLHQLSKGMRDSSGNPLPNAHLHGLFTRICKLLYYRIKPVFVFDGGVPTLKRQTLAARRDKREDAERSSSLMQQKILTNLVRSQALKDAYGMDKLPELPPSTKTSSRGNKDTIFELPPIPETSKVFLSQKSSDDAAYAERLELQQMVEEEFQSIEKINVDSEDFTALPLEIQHEIITDIRLRRKNYNMSKIVELPEESKDFSAFQMAKLVKHNRLNTRLEQLRKELNQRQTKAIVKQYGAKVGSMDSVYSQQLASDETSHYILAKRNLQKKKEFEEQSKSQTAETQGTSGKIKGYVDSIVESDEDTVDELADSSDPESFDGDYNSVVPSTSSCKNNASKEKTKSFRGEFVISSQDDKPRFRPVIEIEPESDTESDDDVKIISESNRDGANFCDNADEIVETDRALQMAIEQSLKEKEDAKLKVKPGFLVNESCKSEHLVMKMTDQEKKVTVCSGRNENSRSKYFEEKELEEENNITGKCDAGDQVPIVTAGRQQKSETNLVKEGKTVDASATSLKDKIIELDDSDIETKVTEKEIRGRSGLFKRKISCLSSDSLENGESNKKPKVVESSDELSGDDDAAKEVVAVSDEDSEDEFIEVKIDLANVEEDDMFPASMFEATDDDKPLPSDHGKRQTGNRNEKLMPEADICVLDTLSGETNTLKSKDKEAELLETKKPVVEAEREITEERSLTRLSSQEDVVDESVSDSVSLRSGETLDEEINKERNVATVDDVTVTSGLPDIIGSTEQQRSSRVPDLVKQFQSLNEDSVRALSYNMAAENRQLQKEIGRQERLAVSITDQMHADAQELLQLFGIPYIVSPTEAEAQCAFLELAKLTNGTITDDSDIWLFGGKTVFKNFFNQQKHVECFKDVHILSNLGLSREPLINLALLCGSDYTEGIRGVGPVVAMEILAEFPGEGQEGLAKLKSWWDYAQKQLVVPKTESKLKAKLRDLDIGQSFPDRVVVDAYLSPTVDESTEKFSWSLPDLDQLRQFASAKLGWDRKKLDETLLPVLKRMSQKQTQRTINAYFQPEVYMQPAKMKSKRLQKVVNKIINPEAEASEEAGASQVVSDGKKTSRRGKSKNAATKDGVINEEGDTVKGDVGNTTDKPKTRAKRQNLVSKTSDEMSKDTVSDESSCRNDSKMPKAKAGRSRGRGRGRGQSSKYFEPQTISETDSVSLGVTDQDEVKVKQDDSDSGSGTDPSSESESSFDDSDSLSADEFRVVSSGLNIEEILSMKMGTELDEGKSANLKETGVKTRVFENAVKVEEILQLNSKNVEENDDFSKDMTVNDTEEIESEKEDNTPDMELEEFDNEIDGDDDKFSDKQKVMDYSLEGGFIREDDDCGQKTHEPWNKMDKQRTEEKKKVMFQHNLESAENGGNKTVSERIKLNVPYDKDYRNVDFSNTSELNAANKQETSEKHEKNFIVNLSYEGAKGSKKTDSKTKALKVKKGVSSIYSEDPLKPVVKGVPWAERGKGKRKGPSGRGKGKTLVPTETIVKQKCKPKNTKEIRSVNLSESDSD